MRFRTLVVSTSLSFLSLASAGLATESLAHADATAAAPSAADKATAHDAMIKGLTQRKNGDLSGALTSFQAADAIMHVPTTALEVARTEEAMGHLLEALDRARAAGRDPVKPGESAVFKDARVQLAAMADNIAPRVPSLQIEVKGAPPGTTANVQLDGDTLSPETLAVARRVNPGHHTIVASAGDAQGKTELDVAERETKMATVMLELPKPVSTMPVTDAPKKKKGDPLLYGGIAGLGLGGAGLIVGTITGILSLHKSSDLKKECPNNVCPQATYDSSSFQSERSSARTFGTVSTIGFIAGGAFAAVGATLLLLRHPSHESDATPSQATLTVGPGFASGTF